MGICCSHTGSSEPCLVKRCSLIWRGWCCCCYPRPWQEEPTSEGLTVVQDSHTCLINVWSSGETENVCGALQSLLPLHREVFLWLLLHFITLSHLEHTKQTYNIRVRTLWREHSPKWSCSCMCALTCIGSTCRRVTVAKLKGNQSQSEWGQAAFSTASLSIN